MERYEINLDGLLNDIDSTWGESGIFDDVETARHVFVLFNALLILYIYIQLG
jgi:hypothetical protein